MDGIVSRYAEALFNIAKEDNLVEAVDIEESEEPKISYERWIKVNKTS